MTDLDLEFKELKVFKEDEEILSEEVNLNDRIQVMKMVIMNTGLKTLFGEMASWVQMPLSPFPRVEKCFGLRGNGSFMQINEGYA